MKKDFFSKNDFPLVLDGAMGSYLHSNGFKSDNLLWFSHLNIENPTVVYNVHEKYIMSGADIITTNTFRTNPIYTNKSTYDNKELVRSAVNEAIKAVKGTKVLVAGSNPPAEDSYQKERLIEHRKLIYNHQKHINLLMEYGCDFILNETQSHLDEIKIILEYCSGNDIPFVISFYFDNNLRLLSGEKLIDVLSLAKSYNPLAVSFNCISKNELFNFLLSTLVDYPWGFYLNYGKGKVTDNKLADAEFPGYESDLLKYAVQRKVSFVGGCCGSGPEHISKIKAFIHGNNNS